MNITNSNFFLSAMMACLAIFFVSCSGTRKLEYFNNLPDSTTVELPPTHQDDRVVELGDRLNITVGGRDQDAAAFFNKRSGSTSGASISISGLTGSTSEGSGGGGDQSGYLVDNNGNIEMPMLGKIYVRGYTQETLKDLLTKKVTPFLKEPLVDVAFTTFRITLMGEVRSPGAHTLSMQRTTILDALAAGGDLPHSAKRYDISLYRDYKGKRTITKIDLRKKDFLYDDAIFQMRHNDLIYVKPRNSSIFTEEFGLVTSIFTIVLTTVTLAITLSK